MANNYPILIPKGCGFFIYNLNFIFYENVFFAVLCILSFSSFAQTFAENNGRIKFASINDYQTFTDSRDYSTLRYYIQNSSIQSLSKSVNNSTTNDLPEFLQLLLNQDFIFEMGNYLIKIDPTNNRALIINSSTTGAYQSLVNNDLNATGIIIMSDEEMNAFDVLAAIEAGTLTPSDYNNATEEARIRWPWNRCNGAKREKDKDMIWWDEIKTDLKDCNKDKIAVLWLDCKVVYQKFIFYFALEGKANSRIVCKLGGKPETGGPYNADLKYSANARYIAVYNCRNVHNETRPEVFVSNDNKIHWNPYESSRALHKYDYSIQFFVKHAGENQPYKSSKVLRITDF